MQHVACLLSSLSRHVGKTNSLNVDWILSALTSLIAWHLKDTYRCVSMYVWEWHIYAGILSHLWTHVFFHNQIKGITCCRVMMMMINLHDVSDTARVHPFNTEIFTQKSYVGIQCCSTTLFVINLYVFAKQNWSPNTRNFPNPSVWPFFSLWAEYINTFFTIFIEPTLFQL